MSGRHCYRPRVRGSGVRGRNLEDSSKDAISEWEAYRITRFEGGTGGGCHGALPRSSTGDDYCDQQ